MWFVSEQHQLAYMFKAALFDPELELGVPLGPVWLPVCRVKTCCERQCLKVELIKTYQKLKTIYIYIVLAQVYKQEKDILLSMHQD